MDQITFLQAVMKKPAAFLKPAASKKPAAFLKPAAFKKPASWLKLRPDGCGKCRHVPGCTPSCWKYRGDMPKK